MARWLGRGAHDVFVRLGELAAVVILIIGFGLWRLMQGPIELDRLAPYVQQAFDRSDSGLRIAMTGVRFGIDHDTHQLDLWVEGVRVSSPSGEPLASFPEMATSFSLGSLLAGALAPTRVIVERPVVRLVRGANGAIRFRVGDQDSGSPGFGPAFLAQLTGPPQRNTAFGLLRRVIIRDATVILDDQATHRRWRASRADATIERNADGIAGDLSLAVTLGADTPELHASYRYSTALDAVDLELAVDGIEPAALASLSPNLAVLAAAQFPVSGTVETRLDLATATTEGVRLDLGFGKGSLRNDQLADGTLRLEQGELHAVYAPESGQLRLDKLSFDLGGGSTLSFNGSLDGVTPGVISGSSPAPASLPGTLGIVLANVPIAKFESLWPPALSRGGRRWVLANIHEGVLDQAAMQLDLAVDPAARSAEVVAVHGVLGYHDLTIDFFKGLPLARKVSGTATLADKRLDFLPTAGMIKAVQLTGGSIQITDLGAKVETLAIDLTLAGPLQDVLEIIDSKPLRYAHELGIDPAEFGGRVETALHFKFPLLDALKFDMVEYSAKASITGAALGNIVLNRGLTDGTFALEVGRAGAHLQGNARFDGTPTALDANVFFNPKDGPRARYHVALTLDGAARRRLGLDLLPDRIAGPIGVDLTYSVLDGTRAEAVATLDLRDAGLAIDEAGWRKAPGVPGTTRLAIDLDAEKIVRGPQIEIKTAGLDAGLALTLTPGRNGIERLDIQHLVLGDDDVSGVVARRPEGGWHVDLHGPRLDLTNVLKPARKDRSPPTAEPPLQIDARLGRVVLGPKREVRDLSAQLLREQGLWQTARIDARYPDGHSLTLRFGDDGVRHPLTFTSNDLGSTLALLDVADNVVGGRVTVTGQVTELAGKREFRGHVEGRNYSLVRAPAFARLLSLASLDGLDSMLSGTGIPFTTLRANIGYTDDRLTIERLVAYGGAIGVTASGVYDLDQDRLDVQGTLAPAHTLNSILGNVPVIGKLLLGGDGQSLFAASYHVTGAATDPEVSVNPLSALAPGFLRRLFQPNFGFNPVEQESERVQ